MKGQPSDRAVMLGEYILEQKATVRATAAQFGISKSTVHKDVSERLPLINPDLYAGVKAILEQNKQERHIRSGNMPCWRSSITYRKDLHPQSMKACFPKRKPVPDTMPAPVLRCLNPETFRQHLFQATFPITVKSNLIDAK